MRNVDLEINTVDCSACLAAGFTPGSEFFDPLVLPHLSLFTKFPQLVWRVHLHLSAEGPRYFIEMLFESSRGAFLQIDGPANEDPKIAVEQALMEVRRGVGQGDE